MNEKHYALRNVATRFKDDGTRVYVALDMHESAPARFYANWEGLSVLVLQLKGAAQKMAQLLVASGGAEKFNVASRDINPMRVVSSQAGPTSDGTGVVVSAQTEDGPLVDLLFPPDLFRRIVEAAPEILSKTRGDAKGPSIN
jgi:hypothetical protein